MDDMVGITRKTQAALKRMLQISEPALLKELIECGVHRPVTSQLLFAAHATKAQMKAAIPRNLASPVINALNRLYSRGVLDVEPDKNDDYVEQKYVRPSKGQLKALDAISRLLQWPDGKVPTNTRARKGKLKTNAQVAELIGVTEGIYVNFFKGSPTKPEYVEKLKQFNAKYEYLLLPAPSETSVPTRIEVPATAPVPVEATPEVPKVEEAAPQKFDAVVMLERMMQSASPQKREFLEAVIYTLSLGMGLTATETRQETAQQPSG
jgi:hypothetical protein